MTMRRTIASRCSAAVPSRSSLPQAQQKPPVVTTPRIYVFEAGSIRGLDPKLFSFTREELKEVDFVNIAYLIVHPNGTIMFDTGGIPDSTSSRRRPVTEGIMSATKPLKPQLAAAGYKPSDITLPRAVALPLRPHGQRQRLRRSDVDRSEGRARLHVRGQAAGHHPAGALQRAQEREDDGAEQRGPRCVRRWDAW